MKFRDLRANEIDLRVGTVSKFGYTLLLYKDARCDMNILDETVGEENWQRDHKEVKGNLYCGVSIWDNEKKQWITKWDCGTESYTEKEKGEASDSFKRACFNWGIGRELYTAPLIYIYCKTEEFNGKYKLSKEDTKICNNLVVKVLEIENKIIKKLVIVNKKDGMVAFSYGVETPKVEEPEIEVLNSGKYKGKTIQWVFDNDREYFDKCAKSVTSVALKQAFLRVAVKNNHIVEVEV